MNAADIIMRTTRLVVAQNEKGEYSAKQLRDFLNDFGAMMLRELLVAPCDHEGGSRWTNRGKQYCGICNREIADANTV